MLILIVLFSLLKTENYIPLYSHYQKKTIKNYQNFLANDLKDQCIGINIKQKVRGKILQMSTDIFSNETF